MIIETLQEVNSKLAALHEAGIEVVAVSADKEEVATVMVEELSLGFPVASSSVIRSIVPYWLDH